MAQIPAAGQQNDNASELWRIRSQSLTDELLKDGADLKPLRRAVLWTRLAQRWWKQDRRRATIWLGNAVEVVEQVPNKESPEDREERLRTAREMLPFVAALEPKLAKRLVNVLTPNDTSANTERLENANALIYAANSLFKDDPRRAAELGALALRLGPPDDFSSLLFYLRSRDPNLANGLLVQALTLAKPNPTGRWLNSLTYVAFPASRGLTQGAPIPPDPLRIEVLQLLIAYINANPFNDQNKDTVCATLAFSVAPLLGEFERLLPQQTPVARQAINQCQSVTPLVQQQFDSTLQSESLNSVEALLKAAAEAKDVRVQTVYEFRAATMARNAQDYERALKILDRMGKDEREFMGDMWEFLRWDWTAEGALNYFYKGSLLDMNLLLNGVPSDLRPLAKIAFLTRMKEPKDFEPAPIVQILTEAITELRRSSVSDSDKHNWYFTLLKPALKYQPADANAVLKAAVSSLNQNKDRKTLDTAEFSEGIAESLLQMDEYIVKDSLASITLVETRAQLRLALLKESLDRTKLQ
ncbi:MAG TPA: hypothetical protein VGD61_12690 [Pyrinomonadaceae bacterium]